MTTTAPATSAATVPDQVTHLQLVLADAIVLQQKLRHYHWSVTGPQFFVLHEQFEKWYDEVSEFIDATAERIVALGARPLPTLGEVLRQASLDEDPTVPAAAAMVQILHDDFTALASRIEETIALAEDGQDRTTVNLLDGMADGLRSHVWMMASTLA